MRKESSTEFNIILARRFYICIESNRQRLSQFFMLGMQIITDVLYRSKFIILLHIVYTISLYAQDFENRLLSFYFILISYQSYNTNFSTWAYARAFSVENEVLPSICLI